MKGKKIKLRKLIFDGQSCITGYLIEVFTIESIVNSFIIVILRFLNIFVGLETKKNSFCMFWIERRFKCLH